MVFRFNTGQVLMASRVRGGKDLQAGFYPYHTTTVGASDDEMSRAKPAELPRSRATSKEDLSPGTSVTLTFVLIGF